MKKGRRDVAFQLRDSQSQRRYGKDFGPVDRSIPFELPSWRETELMRKVPPLVVVLPVLVFIQGKGIGRVLIVVDTILPFLSQLKIIVDIPFHDHLLFGAQP